jgi:hypothetical protein
VQIGAPVFANREAVFALATPQAEGKRAATPRLGVQVTRSLSAARLTLQVGEKVLWERELDLSPELPFSADLPAAVGKPAGKNLAVMLTDSSGEILARWVRRAGKEPERPVKGYIKIEPIRSGRPRPVYHPTDYHSLARIIVHRGVYA